VPAGSPVAQAGGVANCPPAGSATRLDGAGATFPAPLYTRWFAEYKTLCNVEINYQAIGSGGGIAQHTAKTVDFGASDGILTQAQKDAAPNTLMIPTVAGSEALVVNLPGLQQGQLKLSGETVAGIFLGEITKWNDPKIAAENSGVNLPNQDVVVVHRSDGSGTTNIFTNYLSAVSPTWKDKVGAGNSVNWPTGLGGEGNAGVAGQVRQLPGAIGYVELAYAKQNNMTWASLKNKAGNYLQPTLEATTAAMEGVSIPPSTEVMIVDSSNPQAYPIAGFTWILAYQNPEDAAKARTVAHFLWWATHEGERLATQLDYAPLSPAATTAAEAQIRKIQGGGI
jgi:phosphate transport system substrate-binding protein